MVFKKIAFICGQQHETLKALPQNKKSTSLPIETININILPGLVMYLFNHIILGNFFHKRGGICSKVLHLISFLEL